MNVYIKNILRFCVIIILQVLILNKITLRWWSEPGFPIFIPYVYPLFLLLLPFETPVWALLIIGFILGTTVDSFMNTAGMHACVCLLGSPIVHLYLDYAVYTTAPPTSKRFGRLR